MGLSVNVPMLETEGCVTESETGFTDTAEPAAAGEEKKSKPHFYTGVDEHHAMNKEISTLLNRRSSNKIFTFY